MGWIAAAVVVAAVLGACGDASDPVGMMGRGSRGTAGTGSDPTDPTTGETVQQGPVAPGSELPPGAGIPCDVAAILADKCLACHGDPVAPGALAALVTITDLLAPAKQDPTKSEAQLSLERMKTPANPMPPASFNKPPTLADISAFEVWIKNGYVGSCGDAGAPPTGPLSCTSCHGDANRTAVAGADANVMSAPPRSTKNETATTARAVGAHMAHLTKGAMANPIKCNECHIVPTTNNHSDGTALVTFGTLAKTGNKTPAWNGTTCTASYCHGNFTGGNLAAAPSWTAGAMTCTSCHDGPPATGDHRRGPHNVPCSDCHGTGYTANAVNKALHINGVKNAGGAGSKITNWNPATRSCTPTCHGTETW